MSIRRAGTLDMRITIQRKTIDQSNSGEVIETWTDLATRWAAVSPMTGTERLSGEILVAKEQVQFRFRWDQSLDDLSPLDRIIMPPTATPTDLETYNIVQASQVGRHDDILVLAYRFANAH
jgi:head-tail adaptor